MIVTPLPCELDRPGYYRVVAALADGPEADTPEPVTAEAGRPVTEPDRYDTDTMGHG